MFKLIEIRQPRTKLGLDAALKQITNTKSKVGFEGWSEARIRSFKMIEKNPNSYYYRFNEPGEEQRRGPWTEVVVFNEHAISTAV